MPCPSQWEHVTMSLAERAPEPLQVSQMRFTGYCRSKDFPTSKSKIKKNQRLKACQH